MASIQKVKGSIPEKLKRSGGFSSSRDVVVFDWCTLNYITV